MALLINNKDCVSAVQGATAGAGCGDAELRVLFQEKGGFCVGCRNEGLSKCVGSWLKADGHELTLTVNNSAENTSLGAMDLQIHG